MEVRCVETKELVGGLGRSSVGLSALGMRAVFGRAMSSLTRSGPKGRRGSGRAGVAPVGRLQDGPPMLLGGPVADPERCP